MIHLQLRKKSSRDLASALIGIAVVFFLSVPVMGLLMMQQLGASAQTMETKLRKLTPAEARVIVGKGTEAPFSGAYVHNEAEGTYCCRQCGHELFRSADKFDSGTGWPSFDQALPGAVREIPDADGSRTEIVCASCGAHLGHVFRGEGMTPRDTRNCVNSISLDFQPAAKVAATAASEVAYFAGGCFWGVEYYFDKVPGVLAADSGYMGGFLLNPSYQDVSSGETGHAETVRVTYDPAKVTYEQLAKLFFEIHDPTQVDRQGPDVGGQYRSEIFYADEQQKIAAETLIQKLKERGYRVATRLQPAGQFFLAEKYHQDWYQKKGGAPYCHVKTKRFGD